MPFFGKTKTLIPKIKETHHAAEQLTKPTLLQLEVDVLGTAAKHMQVIEKVVGTPFADLGIQITDGDGHSGLTLLALGDQKATNLLSASDEGRIDDVRVFPMQRNPLSHRSKVGIRR